MQDCFLLLVQNGDRFKLLKSYKATLDYVSTNYIQSELRQFTLEYTYYYYDAQTKELKKIKLSKKKITDEFKPIMDVSSYLEDDLFNSYPEKAMQLIFAELNKK